MADDIMGAWHDCSDGKVHHFVGPLPLCGRRVGITGPSPTKVSPPRSGGGPTVSPDTSRRCPACVSANLARWAGEYGPETGVPLDRRETVT